MNIATSRRIVWTAALALAATTAFIAWSAAQWHVGPRPAADALVAAVQTQRLIEPRLVGGFPYAELRVRRGPGDTPIPPDIRIAAARVEKETDPSDPRQLASRGAARLLGGQVSAAIEDLADASSRLSGDGGIWSDYAASLLVAAAREPSRALSLRVQALDAASRATRIAPALAEAWFNRALAAETIPPAVQAAEAWQDCLRVDSTSGWAAEAKRHLARVRAGEAIEPGAEPHRQRFERDLLPQWATLVMTGGDLRAAATALAVETRALADAGDALPAEAMRVAGPSVRTAAARSLATAVRAFIEARGNAERDRYSEAEIGFRQSQRLFARLHNPFALNAAFSLATISYQRGRMQDAWDAIAPIEAVARTRAYAGLLLRIKWMQGLILANRGHLVAAVADYREALAIAEQLGDDEYDASVSSALADGLRTLGEREQSWRFMERALQRVQALVQPIRRHVLLLNAALFAERDGQWYSALHFHDAALAAARERGGAGPIVDSLTYRAAVLARLGDRAAGQQTVAEASTLLAGVSDPGLRRFLAAALEQARAETLLASDPVGAAGAAAAARAIFEDIEPERVPRVLLLEARAARATGRLDLADATLQEGIKRFETYRASLDEPDLRISYFDVAWSLYSELADVRLERGDGDGALRAAERGRSRSLSDLKGGAAAPDAPIPAVPPSIAAVEFLVLEKRTIAWVIANGARLTVEIPAGRASLDRLTTDLRREIAEERPPVAAAALYDLIVAPLRSKLPPEVPVVFVPDGPLSHVPFAALRDRRGQYLIDQRAIAILPSLRLLRSAVPTPPRRVVVVGEPAAPGMARLPSAAREAAAIAGMYPEAVALGDREATWPRLRAEWRTADVVHVGAHATANDEFPGYSRLFLAPAPGHDGVVFPQDLAAFPPARARVVVLATCRSDSGPSFNGEGVISLARPLLAAGVPAVIGSSWDVDDAATAALFEVFHRRLARDGRVVEALRAAQQALAHSTDPTLSRPRSWAGFHVIGFS